MKRKIKKLLEKGRNLEDKIFIKLVSYSVRLQGYKDYIKLKPIGTKEEIREIKEYWKQYTNSNHPFFQIMYSYINGEFSPKYIPYDLYIERIDKYLNNEKFLALDNKCYYPVLFNCKQPKMLYMCINGIYYNCDYEIISREHACRLVEKNGKAIFKPATVSGGGVGIKIWHKGDSVTPNEIMKNDFGEIQDYVCQDIQKQHENLARIHKNSLNTLRIFTLLINNKVEILSSILRMGANGGFVDNFCGGGYACGIENNGHLKKYGYSEAGNKATQHPQAGEFAQYVVPSFDKAKEMVKREAERFPYFRLIAWDIAIDPLGEPVLIEANFSKGSLTLAQYTNGPLFGEYTDLVLAEVFQRTHK